MLKAPHLFRKLSGILFAGALAILTLPETLSWASEAGDPAAWDKKQTGLYRDVFDQNLYYEGTQILHLDRVYRRLFGKKISSANVNLYDEVPDNSLFTNRHARNRLSAKELENGYRETDGPDLSGPLTVVKGKFEGLHPGFFVRDQKGDEYLFKFDPLDYRGMVTGAEIVGSRFLHAIGYHVPQYTIEDFDPAKLVPADDATMIDDTGFKKPLTREKLEEYLRLIPQDGKGYCRASASKILKGKILGYVPFHGRRKENPEDLIDHEYRREFRALPIFASWINDDDMRESNSLEVLEDGKVKHYLIDFNTALGVSVGGPKPPMKSYEHIFDYGETLKAFLSLGFWEKPWQKKWRESGEEVAFDSSVGYFDNRYFKPQDFKTQLPHYVFKDRTLRISFGPAKIIKSFSDEDIRMMVKAGKYHKEDAEKLAGLLAERRDIIARYGFGQANPLDHFVMQNQKLTFQDLSVIHGFAPEAGNTYHFDVIGKKGNKGEKIVSLESQSPQLIFEPSWFSSYPGVEVLIRTSRQSLSEKSPYMLVEMDSNGITGIRHQA